MGAGGLAKRLGGWPICLIVLAGCSSGSATGPITTSTSAPSESAPPASAAPVSATLTPGVPMCILELPAQVPGDNTPITFVYFGRDAARCAQDLATLNDPVTGSQAQNPAKIVTAIPSGSPVCSDTSADGTPYAIYGTLAALQACGTAAQGS